MAKKYGLGRIVEHDPASREYEYPRRATLVATSVIHTLKSTALNQGSLGACVGFAGAAWLNCSRNIEARRKFNDKGFTMSGWRHARYLTGQHAIDLYSDATKFDSYPGEYPPVDTGASALGLAKALQRAGVISRYEWTFSWPGFLAALRAQPVLLGINWYNSMFVPGRGAKLDVNPSSGISGGHEVLARGIDVRNSLIRIRNSWGPDWGLNGDAYIPMFDLQQLLIHEKGDCVVPIV